MKRRIWKTLISALLATVLLIGAMPVSAASVSTNFNTIVSHINEFGEADENGNITLGFYVTVDGGAVYFFLRNVSTGIEFQTITVSDATTGTDVDMSFILQKNNNYFKVKFYEVYFRNSSLVDELETSRYVNRTTMTIEKEYTISGSEYIPDEAASEAFTSVLQMLCVFWHSYFKETVGFGLKELGFSSYCTHEYDHDCDPLCNLCEAWRNTTHRFTGEKVDAGDYHTSACIVCGYVGKFSHHMVQNTDKNVSVTCLVDGERWTYCTECGKEECVITPKGERYHFFTNWKEIDEETHTRTCMHCQKEEVSAHNLDSFFSILPTADHPGVWTTICMFCDYKHREEVLYIPGDIDGNGQVNRDDVVALLLHVSMPEAFPITIPADYNGDGLVTRDDVIQLLLHVSMPDAFPLS